MARGITKGRRKETAIFKRNRNIIKDFVVGHRRFDTRETTNTRDSHALRILKKRSNPKKTRNNKKSSDTSLARKRECDGARARARESAPVERGAHIVLIGNPDSQGVS